MSWYSFRREGLLLHCLVQPGAASDEITGLHDAQLRIRLNAPPTGGQANQRLCSFLANTCSLAKRDVSVQRGHSNRRKTVLLAGVEQLPDALAGLPAGKENL